MWISCCAQRVKNLTSIYGDAGSIPGVAQWVKDLVLLWLWHRLAAAAPSPPLAWELLYATGAALKIKKKVGIDISQKKKKGYINGQKRYEQVKSISH